MTDKSQRPTEPAILEDPENVSARGLPVIATQQRVSAAPSGAYVECPKQFALPQSGLGGQTSFPFVVDSELS